MPSEPVDELLRALYRGRDEDPEAARASASALEDRLVAAHARRYGAAPRRRGIGAALSLWRRAAVALVVFALLSAGACQMPVNMHVVMGQRIHLVLPATDEMKARVHEITNRVEAMSGATRVEVKVRHDGGETMRLVLGVWGELVDPDAVFEDVAAAFPELEIIEREAAPLEATVRTTLGDKLRHDLFQRALDEESVEDAKRVILEQLAAEGFSGDADVQVYGEEDGHRRVEIRLRGDGQETEDIAELKRGAAGLLDAGALDAEIEIERDSDELGGGSVDARVKKVVKVTEIIEERGGETATHDVEVIRGPE